MVTWNNSFEAAPANASPANAGANSIRELKQAVSERLELELNFKTGTQPLLKAGVAAVCYAGNAAQIANVANSSNGALAWDTGLKTFKRYDSANWSALDVDHGSLAGLTDDDHTQYLNLTKANQTLTANLTVAANVTIDGRDISADGALLVTLAPFIPPAKVMINSNHSAIDTQIDVSASVVVANASNILAGNVSGVISANTSGAFGLDTGSLAANTFYRIYAIANSSNFAAVLSANATTPTLPAGYTHFRKIGVARTTANTTNMTPFYQQGNLWMGASNSLYTYTSSNSANWYALSNLANAVPVGDTSMLVFYVALTGTSLFTRPANWSANSANSFYLWTLAANESHEAIATIPIASNGSMEARMAGSSMSFRLLGFVLNL